MQQKVQQENQYELGTSLMDEPVNNRNNEEDLDFPDDLILEDGIGHAPNAGRKHQASSNLEGLPNLENGLLSQRQKVKNPFSQPEYQEE